MTNNRLKIVNKRRKRKTINNIALIIVIIGIFILSVLFLKNNYLEKDNTIHEIVSATTTSTTTTIETTTVSTTTEVINNTYAKNFVYSFTVVDDNYKILICNKDSYARLSTYNLYYNNKLIGGSTSVQGLIVNKDSGMVVHPAAGNYSHTLVNALLYRFNLSHKDDKVRPGIVHRIDKDNSGVITPEELKRSFNIYHKNLTEEQIKNIMSVSDDNNDFLTYSEFIICCLRVGDFLTPTKLFDAFLFFDIDNNNVIDSNDLYLTLLRWGKDVTDKKDIEDIIFFGTKKKYKQIDINAFIDVFSDEINKNEFILQINKLKEEMKKNKDSNNIQLNYSDYK